MRHVSRGSARTVEPGSRPGEFRGTAGILSIPGGLFEVAVAIWLIARGFSSPVTASARAGADVTHTATSSLSAAS